MLLLGVLRTPIPKTKRVPCRFPFKQVKVSLPRPFEDRFFFTLSVVLIYIGIKYRPRRVSGCITRAAVAEVPIKISLV